MTIPKEQNTGKDRHCYWLLGLFLGIAYLPLSSLRFAVKNDALRENFPPKYFFSAALHSGHWPLWNPYINFGLPAYADPGFAFWHPLTWIFGGFGYQVWVLSIEILVFIWLGGIFMYRLGRYLQHSRLTAFLMGALFMCCGFFTGNLTHTNFLTCAAFLPLAIHTFLQLQDTFTPKRLFLATGSFYLLVAGGHPAIPIGMIYFLVTLLIALILTSGKTKRRSELIRTFRINIPLLLAVMALTTPIWLSWLEIWPYFDRSSPVHQQDFEETGFTVNSWLSFLFPFSTMAKTTLFGTDRSMRSGYFSFIGLALLLPVLFGKKNRLQIVFLCGAIVMLILSLGGPFKSSIYSHLPMLRFIRTNGEYRIFTLFSFIIILSWPLEALWRKKGETRSNKSNPSTSIQPILTVFGLLAITAVIIAAATIRTTATPQLNPAGNGLIDRIKAGLDTLPFSKAMLIDAAILLTFIATWFLLRNRISSRYLITALVLTDLAVHCWLSLPVTGIQRRSPATIQHLLDDAPPGIPKPTLMPLATNDRPELQLIVGCWSYYSKQPGTPIDGDYPVVLRTTAAYFDSHWPDSLNRRPFLFLAHSPTPPAIETYSPTTIAITATTTQPDTLILLQNNFPGWHTSLDGHPCPHLQPYEAFISIPLPAGKDNEKGNHHIEFHFTPGHLKIYLLISLATLLGLLAATAFSKRISDNLSTFRQ